jgi:uncharacterized protein (TIGR02001 family)
MRNLLICGAFAAVAAAPALAQEVTVTGNVALVSDYQWRNVTQTNYDATIQGGLDLSTSNCFYAGVWASGVDFNNGTDSNLEVDVYGGFTFTFAGLDADVGAIYYAYPDSGPAEPDFWEVYGRLSKTFDKVTLGGSLNWDPDNENIYIDAGVDFAVTDTFTLSAGFGHYEFDLGGDYDGWSVGGALDVGGVSLGLSYHDTDITGLEESVVFSIGKSL